MAMYWKFRVFASWRGVAWRGVAWRVELETTGTSEQRSAPEDWQTRIERNNVCKLQRVFTIRGADADADAVKGMPNKRVAFVSQSCPSSFPPHLSSLFTSSRSHRKRNVRFIQSCWTFSCPYSCSFNVCRLQAQWKDLQTPTHYCETSKRTLPKDLGYWNSSLTLSIIMACAIEITLDLHCRDERVQHTSWSTAVRAT